VDRIVSDQGFGSNPYIETTRPLVVLTAPGPNSGKLATCLSQVYHEHIRGTRAGYAKFETFPIWNLPLRHPVNAAYEAATAELKDVNMIDPFHLEAYGERSINYNRDVEAFPVLHRILGRITGSADLYKSPTDMGVNRAGFAIVDDDLAAAAGKQEIIRRYFRYQCEYVVGTLGQDPVQRIERLMEEFAIRPEDRPVVVLSRQAAVAAEGRAEKGSFGVYCGAATQLRDGTFVTGSNSPLMHAAPSMVLNAVKHLAGVPHHLPLLSPNIVEAVANLKKDIFHRKTISLDLEETFIALSISSTSNPAARAAMDHLPELTGCEVHLTHLPTPGDETGLRRLGVNLTCDPQFATNKLFVS
jgi:uncharacterized protein (UPF0371 family)